MRRPFLIWLLFTCMAVPVTYAQLKQPKEYRILLLLNAGRSMKENWNNHETRYQLSSRIITTLMDSMYSINDQVAFGLHAYGHLHAASLNRCNDNRLEVPFNKDNRAQINLRLLDLTPKGTASLAYAIKDAANNHFTDTAHYYYSVLIITDSSNHCDNDICGATKELLNQKINFKTYIITIGNKEIANKYNCIGRSLPVATEEDIVPAIQYITSNYRKFLPRVQEITVRRKAIKPQDELRPPSPEIKKEPVVKKENARQDTVKAPATDILMPGPSVVIRKNSNITTGEDTRNYGYMELKSNYYGSLSIYHYQNGRYIIADQAESIIRTVGYKIKLKEGMYKIVYGNREKTFRIVKDMITDVWLY